MDDQQQTESNNRQLRMWTKSSVPRSLYTPHITNQHTHIGADVFNFKNLSTRLAFAQGIHARNTVRWMVSWRTDFSFLTKSVGQNWKPAMFSSKRQCQKSSRPPPLPTLWTGRQTPEWQFDRNYTQTKCVARVEWLRAKLSKRNCFGRNVTKGMNVTQQFDAQR